MRYDVQMNASETRLCILNSALGLENDDHLGISVVLEYIPHTITHDRCSQHEPEGSLTHV
jgi:hypothetical protein